MMWLILFIFIILLLLFVKSKKKDRVKSAVLNRIRSELPSFEIDTYTSSLQEDGSILICTDICGYLVSTNDFIMRRIQAVYKHDEFISWENQELNTLSKKELSKNMNTQIQTYTDEL